MCALTSILTVDGYLFMSEAFKYVNTEVLKVGGVAQGWRSGARRWDKRMTRNAACCPMLQMFDERLKKIS